LDTYPAISFDAEEREKLVIRLVSASYARFVGLLLEGISDNYFDLTAGRERTVTVGKDQLPPGISAARLIDILVINSAYDIA